MPDIQVFGAPVTKLIEVVSAAIGVKYKPRAMRNEADAEAYKIEKIAEAEAKASLIKFDAEAAIAERAKTRLIHQEIQRQENIEAVLNYTEDCLNEEISNQSIDDDWITKFFNRAQDVKSDDLRKIWGKILADEISNPGCVSFRTLDILSNLTKSEAEIILKLSRINSSLWIFELKGKNWYNEYDIHYGDLLRMKSAGIMFYDADIYAHLDVGPLSSTDERNGVLIHFGDDALFITHPTKLTFPLKVMSLTVEGAEIIQLFNDNKNIEYINQLSIYLTTQGYNTKMLGNYSAS